MRKIGPFDLDGLTLAEVAEHERLAALPNNNPVIRARLCALSRRRPMQNVYPLVHEAESPKSIA